MKNYWKWKPEVQLQVKTHNKINQMWELSYQNILWKNSMATQKSGLSFGTLIKTPFMQSVWNGQVFIFERLPWWRWQRLQRWNAGFTLTEVNFKRAIESWKRRFGRQDIICRGHAEALWKWVLYFLIVAWEDAHRARNACESSWGHGNTKSYTCFTFLLPAIMEKLYLPQYPSGHF